MIRFQHLTRLNRHKKILRAGINISRRSDGWSGVFCVPMLNLVQCAPRALNYWRYALRSIGRRTAWAQIIFALPDDEPVLYFEDWGHRYSITPKDIELVTARHASDLAMAAFRRSRETYNERCIESLRERGSTRGVEFGMADAEVIVPRRIEACEIRYVRMPNRRAKLKPELSVE